MWFFKKDEKHIAALQEEINSFKRLIMDWAHIVQMVDNQMQHNRTEFLGALKGLKERVELLEARHFIKLSEEQVEKLNMWLAADDKLIIVAKSAKTPPPSKVLPSIEDILNFKNIWRRTKKKISTILEHEGIDSVDKLIKLTEADLHNIDGLAVRDVNIIKAGLSKFGLSLKASNGQNPSKG